MSASLTVMLNGKSRSLEGLSSPASVAAVLSALDLKQDRIAVERNGEILARRLWPGEVIEQGDRLEIVHFVGGGTAAR